MNAGLHEHLSNREWMMKQLRAEIAGPDVSNNEEPLIVSGEAGALFSWAEWERVKRQQNGEEVLWQDPPTKRFGAGILYPREVDLEAELLTKDQDNGPSAAATDTVAALNIPEIRRAPAGGALDEGDDYAVSLANAYRPSAVGLSFLGDFSAEAIGLKVDLVNIGRLGNGKFSETAAATYRKVKVMAGDVNKGSERILWLRQPMLAPNGGYPQLTILGEELLTDNPVEILKKTICDGLLLIVVVRKMKDSADTSRLITMSLLNVLQAPSEGKAVDEYCFYQCGVRVTGFSGKAWVLPYPEKRGGQSVDPLSEHNINRLLYREYQTFAIGHGCAADWREERALSATGVWTDILPAYETPSTSTDLAFGEPPQPMKISMRKLANLDKEDDGMEDVRTLVDEYANWIEELSGARTGQPSVPINLEPTASALVKKCVECLRRIKAGLAFLEADSELSAHAREAFKLSNHAMLIARLRTNLKIREPVQPKDKIIWEPAIENPDPSAHQSDTAHWRPFQIAFLLMSLEGICDPESDERDIVDLIWFPTGGGKTEAYLGLTAFTVFFNQISGRPTSGAAVLMRYTLRLLTIQQFQRATLLFCAMEHLRRKDVDTLGSKPFRIGLWVGGAATPNKRETAIRDLKTLKSKSDSANPFLLLKCPWCGARFGTVKPKGRTANSVFGYVLRPAIAGKPATVIYQCGDSACEFGVQAISSGIPLPICVIDEDLMDEPPSLIIGTVDKFAMLAWKPEIRSLFGIGPDGRHTDNPPSLIIQDELHLISGPLGTMVGAYETVVELLCRRDGEGRILPKIIASTATISRAEDQVRNLYARSRCALFPPSGLESGDSFFSRDQRNVDGSMKPGRLYAGIMAPSHGSLQTTQARAFACMLQHSELMPTTVDQRDAWWTLLCFYNAIRELGGASTLFVADILDYFKVILDREGVARIRVRKLHNVTELTSRIPNDQMPKELEMLERRLGGEYRPDDLVDACLASNIIEVGVDIPRLSLMAVVGQPKTTSQYIQVTSRVGRDAMKPGLVAILYGQSKPRDRSHYERFRSYHQSLYAQVEPSSVTPFSAPAVERALHGIVVALVRQLGRLGTEAQSPRSFKWEENASLRQKITTALRDRIESVAPKEVEEVMERLAALITIWQKLEPVEYGDFRDRPEDAPLMYPAGSTPMPIWENLSWPTLSSLRNVDASCEANILSGDAE